MTAKPVMVMGGVEWLLLITLSLLWGGSFFFTAVALAELPPFTVVLGRVGLATGALLLLVPLSGHACPARSGRGARPCAWLARRRQGGPLQPRP